MPKIKLNIKLKFGEEGTPMLKLFQVTEKIHTFLSDVGKEVAIKIEPEKWVATNFKSSDLNYDVTYIEDVLPTQRDKYNTLVEQIMKTEIDKETFQNKAVKSYIKMSEVIKPTDKIQFGVYNNGNVNTVHTYEFDNDIAIKLEKKIFELEGLNEEKFIGYSRYYGEIKGIIVNWRIEKVPTDEKPFITIRDLKNQKQIKCYYEDNQYDAIYLLAQKKGEIIRIAGFIKYNLEKKEIDQIDIDKIDKLPEHIENDIEHLFGAMPDFIGNLSIKEYIEKLRGISE